MADIVRFLREVKQESLKVTWPSGKEVLTTTIVVFIMVTIISLFLLAADSAIASALELVLNSKK